MAGIHRGRRRRTGLTRTTLARFYVLNNKGENVPLLTLTTINPRVGPEFTQRFNEYRSAQINGSAAPGYSADQATALWKKCSSKRCRGKWASITPDFISGAKGAARCPACVIFGLSLLFVFLILAALYESWSLPFSVLLSTPVAVFGAFAILWLRRVVLGLFLPPYLVQIESDVFLADWLGDADRPGCQERNSHRRVCQSCIRERRAIGEAALT